MTAFRDPENFYELGEERDIDMGELDVVLMRKDPPFDNEFLYATHILDQAQRQGAWVVNRPQSLRDCNEKLFALQFPQCIADSKGNVIPCANIKEVVGVMACDGKMPFSANHIASIWPTENLCVHVQVSCSNGVSCIR